MSPWFENSPRSGDWPNAGDMVMRRAALASLPMDWFVFMVGDPGLVQYVASECDRLEIVKAVGNLLDRGRRLVFDEVPFHTRLPRGAQNRDVIDLAGSQGHVIGHIGVAREQASRGAGLHSLEMHQLPAFPMGVQEFHRVLARMDDPEDVHLEAHVLGIRLRHEEIEQCALAEGHKLVTMDVIKELEAVL